MARIPGKTKINTNSIINPVLDKLSSKEYGSNSQNDFKHIKTPCSYWLRELLLLILTTFLVFLKLGYIYLIARYPKLNIFWICTFDNFSEAISMFNMRWFACSLLLVVIIAIIKEIYGMEVLNIGQWSFTVAIFVVIVSGLVLYVDVLPFFQTIFSWFT